jgi:hypothetical protein
MYSTLFSFEDAVSGQRLIEIVRNDIETEDKSRKYFWLLLSPISEGYEITRLVFQSMNEGVDGWQERGFVQGNLRFSTSAAEFTASGSETASTFAANAEKEQYSTTMKAAVEKFLASQ